MAKISGGDLELEEREGGREERESDLTRGRNFERFWKLDIFLWHYLIFPEYLGNYGLCHRFGNTVGNLEILPQNRGRKAANLAVH